ncbi:MAG: hypothetical protein RL336_1683 [Pseudomonadota bacterium]
MNRLMLLLCVLAWPALAWQVDEADLKARLVMQQQQAYLGEEVAVSLELATPRWFTRAARLTLPTQGDALWLQRQVFADSTRERIDGQMWTLQRWPLAVFPRRAGGISLQPIRVDVGVADADGQSQLRAFTLGGLDVLGVPTGGAALVASDYRVAVFVAQQAWLNRQALPLKAGQSLKVSYHSQAENSLAMLLPEMSPSSADAEAVAIYRELPTLQNITERGQRIAYREDHFTVVAKRDVALHLTVPDIDWLNSRDGSRQRLSVPDIGTAADVTAVQYVRQPLLEWLALAVVVMLLTAIGVLTYTASSPLQRFRKEQQRALCAAVRIGDWGAFGKHLYTLYDSYPEHRTASLATALDALPAAMGDRLKILLRAAFSGESALLDDTDEATLYQLFKQWERGQTRRPVEAHETTFLR